MHAGKQKDVLLLNDTTFRAYLPSTWRVLSAGPEARYIMPHQNDFDIHLGPELGQSLDAVLEEARQNMPDFKPDIIIQFETSQNYFYRGIENTDALTVWRAVDTHMFSSWHPMYSQFFDVVFYAQKDYGPRFNAYTPQAYWLPLHADRRVHHDRHQPRDIEVSFVGSLDPRVNPARVRFFDELRRYQDVQVFSRLSQEAIAKIYNRSLIVLNQCLHKDLNYRVFEAMANGALLLTPEIEAGQKDLFVSEVHFISYQDGDPKDAAEQIARLLANRQKLDAVRTRGRDETLRGHMLEHRVKEALSILADLKPGSGRLRSTGAQRIEYISLMSEFVFELRKLPIDYLNDGIALAAAVDRPATAFALTSLAGKWMKRRNPLAAGFFMESCERLAYTDPRLTQALAFLRTWGNRLLEPLLLPSDPQPFDKSTCSNKR